MRQLPFGMTVGHVKHHQHIVTAPAFPLLKQLWSLPDKYLSGHLRQKDAQELVSGALQLLYAHAATLLPDFL